MGKLSNVDVLRGDGDGRSIVSGRSYENILLDNKQDEN